MRWSHCAEVLPVDTLNRLGAGLLRRAVMNQGSTLDEGNARLWNRPCNNSLLAYGLLKASVMKSHGSHSQGLLLISNDKSERHRVRTALTGIGLSSRTLTTASTAHEALGTLAKTRPRLVIIDDSISDLDGPFLLQALHQHSSEALVLYLTTHHTAELERAVRQLGVLYYTEKPLDLSLLKSVLGAVFTSGRTSRPTFCRVS
jgi:CheY-like chemotaxis protein